MINQFMNIADFCEVMTGIPISRAKTLGVDDVGTKTLVLIPKAMVDGRIVDAELTVETISKVKESLFSREGDILVKTSTPYDCVYVDKAHEGILVTSFAIILRSKINCPVNMRYLATYLNQPQTKKILQNLSTGTALPLIKKSTISNLKIPVVSADKQFRIAALFSSVQLQKEQSLKMIQLSDELLQAEFSRIVFG